MIPRDIALRAAWRIAIRRVEIPASNQRGGL
jgi:hypothetical protein